MAITVGLQSQSQPLKASFRKGGVYLAELLSLLLHFASSFQSGISLKESSCDELKHEQTPLQEPQLVQPLVN